MDPKPSLESEIAAMTTIEKALESFDYNSKSRILQWAQSRALDAMQADAFGDVVGVPIPRVQRRF